MSSRGASLRLAGLALAAIASTAAAGARGAVAPAGSGYPVSAIEIEYALDHPRHIPEADLLDLEVGLATEGDAYTAPRPVDRTVRMRLSSIPRGAVLTASAIQHINQYIVSSFNRRGYNHVIVSVPDIEEGSGRDLRAAGDTGLRLRVWTGRAVRVATLADGPRFASLTVDERTNHTAHEWIRRRSPVQPGGMRGILDARALEDYAALLSRHRGRRVDAQTEPGPRPGTSNVTYRITEERPWRAYAQYSNTGTSSTTKNRERFGFVHGQLLGRDDVLRLDYTTGDFEDVHAVSGAYEAPFTLDQPRLRYRLRGVYSEYDASEVGVVESRFLGEQVVAEGGVVWNAWQRRKLFVDVSAGARFHQMEVDNTDFQDQAEGDATFWVPQLGIEASRSERASDLHAGLDLEVGWSDASQEDIDILGNDSADSPFALLRFDGSYSAYLEPLIERLTWEDPVKTEGATLAHEVALALRGQWAFENRLVPQYQQIAGGLFSVRGYKQAAAAGDNLVIGSAEYRFHLPRSLAPDSDPPRLPWLGEFRTRPEGPYGRPDWDLVLRVFSDAAQVWSSDANDTEPDETLFSVGGGVEMQLLRNLSVRLDAGHVLSTVGSSEAGDTRGHVLATVVY
jgi:hemolysin activation/secretion protein